MSVAVVVPWRAGCIHRERAWAWVKARYDVQHPDWQIIEAPGPEPWIKAAAVNPAVERCTSEIVIVADADIWCDGLQLAVDAVRAGAPWAMPHTGVHRLDAVGTEAVLNGADWIDQPLTQRPYRGVPGGGFVVAPRRTLVDIPIDAQFVGWGQEDDSHALALETLAGPRWRGEAPLIHLWHPPQQRLSRKRGSIAGMERYGRYVKAYENPAQMRALIEEGRCH